MFKKVAVGLTIVGTLALPFASAVIPAAHAADDYIINASDTVPVFTATAAVGKTNFLAVANVGLPYYVGFMIALVILLLVLLPVKKIWQVIAGRY